MKINIKELGCGVFECEDGTQIMFCYDTEDREYVEAQEDEDTDLFKVGKVYPVLERVWDEEEQNIVGVLIDIEGAVDSDSVEW